MKKLIIICAALLLASPVWGILDMSNSDYTNPYTDDQYTMALWHFDETTGTDTPIIDSSTWDDTGHDVEIRYGVANGWVAGTNMELNKDLTWVPGMAGFDTCAKSWYTSQSDSNIGPMAGADPYGTLSTNHGGDYTFEFWMNPDNAGGGWGSRILKKYTGGCFAVGYQNSKIYMGWYAPGGWYGAQDWGLITQDVWTHIMITVDNSQDTDTAVVSFYHNGVPTTKFTTADGKTFSNWDTADVCMFNDYNGPLYSARQYTGMLDEVRISNVLRIPEPTTITLLAMAALAFFRRKK